MFNLIESLSSMESDLGQYSFSCLRVGFMSSCRVDHVFVSVSCEGFMSSCWFHVFVSG